MSERSRLRLLVLQVLVLSLLATLLGRLWYLQVMAGDRYAQASSDNRIREVITPAVRGQILDDQGRPLVDNRTTLVISVDRNVVAAQPDGGTAVLHRLATQLGIGYRGLHRQLQLCGTPGASSPPVCWNGSPYQPIPVANNVRRGVALQIMERREDFPGVSAQLQAIRRYPKPYGANAAQVLGYLGPVTDAELKALNRGSHDITLQRTDLVGRSGLERVYDSYLRGIPGIDQLIVDHAGVVVGSQSNTAPKAGSYLVTSIDAQLQAVVEKQLRAAIARARSQTDPNGVPYHAKTGAAIVMDVRTGRILAMASVPTYNPSIWVNGISTKQYAHLTSKSAGTPLLSRAIQGQYAPASTFKIVSTPAALGAGYGFNETFPCTSSFRIGNTVKTNYESQAHGNITLKQAIEVSCDTVFYRIAYQLWLKEGGLSAATTVNDPLTTMAQSFDFGKATGIDLPGEAPGRIADRAYKRAYWLQTKDFYCHYKQKTTKSQQTPYLLALAAENCVDGYLYRAGDAANFAIGQGDTLVTPLQLIRAYAAIANGGTLLRPEVAKAIVRPNGTLVKRFPPQKTGHLPIPANVISYVQDALRNVPVVGTATYPFTGFPLNKVPIAAKTGTGEVYGHQTTSWFASYAPANNPQYAVVMMVPEGGTGALTSGASVRAIYEALFGIHGTTVNPSKAIYPSGHPPSVLPRIRPDGTIVGSGTSSAKGGG